jgi:metacaspase-1
MNRVQTLLCFFSKNNSLTNSTPITPHTTSKKTKRALLIGINYLTNPRNRLNGCINDVVAIRNLLLDNFGYNDKNIILMTDAANQKSLLPTKDNIQREILKFVESFQPGDIGYFHYSGHGSQTYSIDDDEKHNTDTPNYDDCLCPMDFDNKGFITDDWLKINLVNRLPKDARLRVIIDACHSATMLDLKYVWKRDNEFADLYSTSLGSTNIIEISGCKDSQTSADTWSKSKLLSMGALTMTIVDYLNQLFAKNEKLPTWKEFIIEIHKRLDTNNYDQIPMLSVGDTSIANQTIDF